LIRSPESGKISRSFLFVGRYNALIMSRNRLKESKPAMNREEKKRKEKRARLNHCVRIEEKVVAGRSKNAI